MKYSLVNGERSEAQPGLSGQCPACSDPTIPKCGPVKIRHWAHKGKRICDPWWENETEWHRTWKEHFPKECQEIIQYAEDGEKHIADVKTIQDWVLEFQHSFLKPEERIARNAFYKKLVWVVDGMRRTRDKTQFLKMLNEPNIVTLNGRAITPHTRKIYLNDSALLREWSGMHAPVFFDFGEEVLWCLLPNSQNIWGYIIAFTRHEFIELHNKGKEHTQNFEECLNNLNTIADLVSQHFASNADRMNRSTRFDPLERIVAKNAGHRSRK